MEELSLLSCKTSSTQLSFAGSCNRIWMLPPLLTNILDSDVEVNPYKILWLVNLIFSFCPSLPYLPLKCRVLLLLSGNNGSSSQVMEKLILEQLLTWKNGFIKHLDTFDCSTFSSLFLLSPASLLVVTCQFLAVSFSPPCLFLPVHCLKACVLQTLTTTVPLLCITNL